MKPWSFRGDWPFSDAAPKSARTDYWHSGSALYSKSVCEDPQKVSGPYIQASEDWRGLHMGHIYLENINGK